MPRGYQAQDCVGLLVRVATIMESWADVGHLSLQKSLNVPLQGLVRPAAPLVSERIAENSEDDAATFGQKRRLTVHVLKAKSDEVGLEGKCLRHEVDTVLRVNFAEVPFTAASVFPKYRAGVCLPTRAAAL